MTIYYNPLTTHNLQNKPVYESIKINKFWRFVCENVDFCCDHGDKGYEGEIKGIESKKLALSLVFN